MGKCCFATYFRASLGILFSVGFAVKGVRRNFPAQRYRTRKKLSGKHLLFSIGLNILLCYKYFGLMMAMNFIAVELRGQGEGY